MFIKLFEFLIRFIPESWKQQLKFIFRQIILDATGSAYPETRRTASTVGHATSSSGSLLGFYYQNLQSLDPKSDDFIQAVEELSEVCKILKHRYPSTVLLPKTRTDPVRVSILVPIYSNHKLLLDLIDHLDSQTKFNDFELILINDCPEEPLPSHIITSPRRFPVTLIQNQWNMGYAASNNLGTQYARGDCLVFLNSDVIPKRLDWLERMLETIQPSDTGVVGAKTLYTDTNLIEHFGMFPIYDSESGFWKNAHYFHKMQDDVFPETQMDQEVDMVTGAVLMIRQDLFDELGGFDERFFVGAFEDSDLCRRVRERGYKIRVCAGAVLEHQKSASLKKSKYYSETRFSGNVRLFNHLWSKRIEEVERIGRVHQPFQRKNNKIRVLFVAHGHPPEQMGGTEVYNHHISEAVGSLPDFESIVLARTPLNQAPLQDGEIRMEIVGGVPVFRCYRSGMFFLNEHRPAELEFEMFLRSVRPDVVHFNHTEHLSLNFMSIAKRCIRGPVFYTLNEFLPICANKGLMVLKDGSLCTGAEVSKCAECVSVSPTLIERRDRLYRENFGYVDLFIAPSVQLQQKFIEWGLSPERIHYSQYGMQLAETRKPKQPKLNFRFVFLGQIMPHKGIVTLLEACQILRSRTKAKFEVHIHGVFHELLPSFKRDILNRISQNHDVVTYQGVYDNIRVSEILNEADIVIVPSEWWENSPLTILEAFSCGVPVITSNVGGMKELVVEGVLGLQFEIRNANDLSHKMQLVLESPELLSELRENVKKRPVKSVHANAQELASLYKRYFSEITHATVAGTL